MTVTPAILLRAAAALIRERSGPPSVADWLDEQAAMTAPSPDALRIGVAYLEAAP